MRKIHRFQLLNHFKIKDMSCFGNGMENKNDEVVHNKTKQKKFKGSFGSGIKNKNDEVIHNKIKEKNIQSNG
jgi:hypothetical protein